MKREPSESMSIIVLQPPEFNKMPSVMSESILVQQDDWKSMWLEEWGENTVFNN